MSYATQNYGITISNSHATPPSYPSIVRRYCSKAQLANTHPNPDPILLHPILPLPNLLNLLRSLPQHIL